MSPTVNPNAGIEARDVATFQPEVVDPNLLARSKDKLTLMLQTSLDIQHILSLLLGELQPLFQFCGLHYKHEKEGVDITIGELGVHSFSYRLNTASEQLGEVIFYRRKRLDDPSLHSLELLLSTLICPLRNGLVYHKAVSNCLRDPLTNIGNKTALLNQLRQSRGQATHSAPALSIAVVKINGLGETNRRRGHSSGDFLLQHMADALTHACRDSDTVFRFGGDEFMVLLEGTKFPAGDLISQRLHMACKNALVNTEFDQPYISVQIGVASFNEDESAEALLARAQTACDLEGQTTSRIFA